jgi:hypothetical protein
MVPKSHRGQWFFSLCQSYLTHILTNFHCPKFKNFFLTGFFNLSSTAQVICDLAFWNAYSSKSLKQKNLKKLCSWRSVFSIFFAWGLSPYNDAFLTYSAKSKKSKNAGHIRPGPWKSCHPREEKKNLPCHAPPPVLTWRSVWKGGREGPLTRQPIAQKWNVSFKFSKK